MRLSFSAVRMLLCATVCCCSCAAQAGPQSRTAIELDDTYCFGCPAAARIGPQPPSAVELVQLASNHTPLLRQAIEDTYPAKGLDLGRVWDQLQSPHVDAQSDGKGEAQFDVASVRVNKSHDAGVRFEFPDDGFNATNISVIMLLKLAYSVEEDQIIGLPRWVKSERFDITAKVLGKDLRKLSIEQRKHMIRQLLADRFQLRFHEAEKSVAVYTLVVSKDGSKLRPSKPDGSGPLAEHSHTLRMMGRGYVLGLGVPMELITQMLTDQLGRPVIDRTGLKGDFDFTLHWTPDEEVQPSRGQRVSPQENTGPDSDWPPLLTAVNEQLGLRLKGEKGPAGAIAVDHLEEPSAN